MRAFMPPAPPCDLREGPLPGSCSSVMCRVLSDVPRVYRSPQCPGIKNSYNNMDDPFMSSDLSPAEVEFSDGTTFKGSSEELCYLGVLSSDEASPEPAFLSTDCDAVYSSAPTLGAFPYYVLDSRYVSSLTIGEGAELEEFTCPGLLVRPWVNFQHSSCQVVQEGLMFFFYLLACRSTPDTCRRRD